jgi:hypothetical protein
MRDHNKWGIQNPSEQNSVLLTTLDDRMRDLHALQPKVIYRESENATLRTQNAALQLSMMERHKEGQGRGEIPVDEAALWEL